MSVRDHMNPALFLEVLYIAAGARTPEEQARVAWRASDYVWWQFPRYPVGFCRELNDYLQDNPLPKVDLGFTEEEKREYIGAEYGDLLSSLQAPGHSPDAPVEEQHIRSDNGTGNGEVQADT